MTRLRPLLNDEIAEYVPRLTMTYAAELTEHLFLNAEAAAARATRSATDAFPAGEASAGNWLFAVEDGEGTRVGVLWLGDPFDGEPRLVVGLRHRDRPRASRAGPGPRRDARSPRRRPAAWAEPRIKLNVFARNAVARALYLSLGFEEMSIQMSKAVGEDQAQRTSA